MISYPIHAHLRGFCLVLKGFGTAAPLHVESRRLCRTGAGVGGVGPRGHGRARGFGKCWPQHSTWHHMAPCQIFNAPQVCGVGVWSFGLSLMAGGAPASPSAADVVCAGWAWNLPRAPWCRLPCWYCLLCSLFFFPFFFSFFFFSLLARGGPITHNRNSFF